MMSAGSDMIAKLMRMQLLEEADVDGGGSSPEEEQRLADGRPAWMRTLHTSVSTWLKLVPQVFLIPWFFSDAYWLGAVRFTEVVS